MELKLELLNEHGAVIGEGTTWATSLTVVERKHKLALSFPLFICHTTHSGTVINIRLLFNDAGFWRPVGSLTRLDPIAVRKYDTVNIAPLELYID